MDIELIFETPSKRCPLRRFNGRACVVLSIGPRRRVRRAGRRLRQYHVGFYDNAATTGVALEDELFLQPKGATP